MSEQITGYIINQYFYCFTCGNHWETDKYCFKTAVYISGKCIKCGKQVNAEKFTMETIRKYKEELLKKAKEKDWEAIASIERNMITDFIGAIAYNNIKDTQQCATEIQYILNLQLPRWC